MLSGLLHTYCHTLDFDKHDFRKGKSKLSIKESTQRR